MSSALLNHDVVNRLQARVAELEDELVAWRSGAAEQARWNAQAERVHAVRGRLGIGRYGLGSSRVMIDLMDHPGQPRSYAQLYAAMHPHKADSEANLDAVIKVCICAIRKRLRAMGLGPITNVWGHGYAIGAADAPAIKAALEPADD